MSVIVLSALLPSASAQFPSTSVQSTRLTDLSYRLTTEASSFADNSYRAYTGSFRIGRVDIEQVMAAQQFSAGATLFRRMVTDRRRESELRDAFALLETQQRSLDSYAANRWRWTEIQRLMSSISTELNGGDGGGGPINQYEHGRMTWSGKVDIDARIVVRGSTAELQTLAGTPYDNPNWAFVEPLPSRRVNVTLTIKRTRGEVILEQQPSRANNYSAVVRIRDPRGGAGDYEFELSW